MAKIKSKKIIGILSVFVILIAPLILTPQTIFAGETVAGVEDLQYQFNYIDIWATDNKPDNMLSCVR